MPGAASGTLPGRPYSVPSMDARTFLDLRATDRHHHWQLPVADHVTSGGGFLFGGCGLGAACEAMERTTGRPTVWASAQYLAFAPRGSVVEIEVHEPVTGHFTSQTRAVGSVDGEEIFTVNAAMGLRRHEYEGHWVVFPDVPPPADCPPREFHFDPARSVMSEMELRVAKGRPMHALPGAPGDGRVAMWARFAALEISTTALAIVGDLVTYGFTQAVGDWARGSSIDNTLRIIQLVPSEWILLDIHVHGVANGYGHGNVHLWTEAGDLLGIASQTTIARKPDWARAGKRPRPFPSMPVVPTADRVVERPVGKG